MTIKRQRIEAIIIAHAKRMILNDGLYGLKIGKLTQECGISTTLLYSIYPKKEDILVAIILATYRKFRDAKWWQKQDFSPLEKLIAQFSITDSDGFYDKVGDQDMGISNIICNSFVRNRAETYDATSVDKIESQLFEMARNFMDEAIEQKIISCSESDIQNVIWNLFSLSRGDKLLKNFVVVTQYRPHSHLMQANISLLIGMGIVKNFNSKTMENIRTLCHLYWYGD